MEAPLSTHIKLIILVMQHLGVERKRNSYEIWNLHGVENFDFGLLGDYTVVSTYEATRCHNPDDHKK
jgi:hypothetical protein